MTLSRLLLIIAPFALAFSASCSLAAENRQDKICEKLTEFATSSDVGTSHTVTLRGGWGGDTKDTLMTHECQHSGYAPGKKLCEYLLPHSSWEFGAHNAERASACLDSDDRQRFLEVLESTQNPDKQKNTIRAEITAPLLTLPKDKRVLVTLKFEQPSIFINPPISVFTISAIRSEGK